MQYSEIDYSDDPIGCCLNCDYAKPGCLCYNCKCRKCCYYSSPQMCGGDKGICDIAYDMKEQTELDRRKFKKIYPNKIIIYSRVGLHKSQNQLFED